MSLQEERFRIGRRLAIASISASTVLASGNVAIGALAGSTSVFAAGLEFAGDVLASVVVYLGMSFASRPADENHPYGHGRLETLAGLAVGTILLLGGVGICFQSLGAVGESHGPPGAYAMWPLCGAIVIRSVMSTLKFRYGRRIGSASLVADAWNDAVDILSALAGLAALALTLYRPERFLAADHYGGFAIGLIVVLTGLRVMRDASMQLMDTMPDEALLAEIRARRARRFRRPRRGKVLRPQDRAAAPRGPAPGG